MLTESRVTEDYEEDLLDYNNEPLLKFEKKRSNSISNKIKFTNNIYPTARKLSNDNKLGKHDKLHVVQATIESGISKSSSTSSSKISRNSTLHDSINYYLNSKESKKVMSNSDKDLLPANYFNTDKSVSSIAVTADDDLDNVSYSSDDTVDLISQARDYYLEDEDAIENMKVLLTETRYHGPTFDPSRLSLSIPTYSSSASSSSSHSNKTPYFKIERLDEEPEDKNEEGL